MEVKNGGDNINNNMIIDNQNITEITEINCPECKESSRMTIKDYKIKLYESKNGHSIDNILLDKFEKIQNSNKSQLKCNNTKCENNTFNIKFYECMTCGIKLCQNCKKYHDEKHTIININKCKFHNQYYESYCTKWKLNLCTDCEHDECQESGSILYYGILKLKKHEIEKNEKEIKDLKTKIDQINEIIN